MKETVEHNNRFYTNEKGEIKTENEQLKEWLIIANKENERLKEENTILKQTMSNNSLLINENAFLKERIDKAIEYIEENEVVDYNPTLDGSEDDSYMKLPRSLSLFNEGLDILLDILKGSDKE